MNVLSLFDGMSCGQITLSELGIPVEKYYASEVDKFAIKATMQNFPDTIQLGDVRELNISLLDKIDLIIGGSPCTNLSMSGKRKGLSTKEGMEVLDLQTYLELKENGFEFEGQSYLFWEYIRIYHELIKRGDNPKFFLENVEMGKKWESVFNETMGRKGIHINSALVSAQNRRRIYWTDIHDDIPQPEDKGILLKDIITDGYVEKDKSWCMLESWNRFAKNPESLLRRYKKSLTPLIFNSPDCNPEKGFRTPNITEAERLQTVPEGYTKSVQPHIGMGLLGNGWTVDVISHIFKGIK
jgi:DNA (cytosine-5)-methyltransferase 3A